MNVRLINIFFKLCNVNCNKRLFHIQSSIFSEFHYLIAQYLYVMNFFWIHEWKLLEMVTLEDLEFSESSNQVCMVGSCRYDA